MESYIFDESLLTKIKNYELPAQYSRMDPLTVNPNFKVRPLSIDDYKKGVLDVLKSLTEVGEVSEETFKDYFNKMKNASNSYYIIVIEDTLSEKVVAYGSIILQIGFTRGCNKRGAIEDICVRDDYQGKQLGKVLLNTLILLGKVVGCYKLFLHCSLDKKEFYEKFGFINKNVYMEQRFIE